MKENIIWNKNSIVFYNKFIKYVFDVDSLCLFCNFYIDNVMFLNILFVIFF